MANSKLKNCPFCGSKAKIVEIDNDIDTVTVDIPLLPLLTDGEIK